MKPVFDATIQELLHERLLALENYFNADSIFFYGAINDGLDKPFRDLIEELKANSNSREILLIILNTPGGSAETVERLVRIVRHHYNLVYFLVPDAAYSAGTIFCLSGDRIYMDYSSSLGPIDPQVFNGKSWVPAMGYLDKVEELIKKSHEGTISSAELLLLREQDLAMLRRYEQARDLAIALIKEWLVKYKFKDWEFHGSDGRVVTQVDKEIRAEQIASLLGNNSHWLSHGRSIDASTLSNFVKLRIENYSNDAELTTLVRDYNDLICQYIQRSGIETFFHTRTFI